MTIWKWRDLNHQPFGELLYSLCHACVYVPIKVLLGKRIADFLSCSRQLQNENDLQFSVKLGEKEVHAISPVSKMKASCRCSYCKKCLL